MRLLILIVLWAILLYLCWPLAVLLLVAIPVLWILAIPFRLAAMLLEAVFALLRAMLFLPSRLLGAR
jgi:hypothetical protein